MTTTATTTKEAERKVHGKAIQKSAATRKVTTTKAVEGATTCRVTFGR